jgi:hypothetical protein
VQRWIERLARRIAAGGLSLTVLAGMAMGVDPLQLILRGVVVGLVLYFAIVLVGGLVAQSLLRLAVEEQVNAKERLALQRRSEGAEPEDGGTEEDAVEGVSESMHEDEETQSA